jgi:hypothetical protein
MRKPKPQTEKEEEKEEEKQEKQEKQEKKQGQIVEPIHYLPFYLTYFSSFL